MVREGRIRGRHQEYDEARALADDSNAAADADSCARKSCLRRASWREIFARARAVAEEAAKYRYPLRTHTILARAVWSRSVKGTPRRRARRSNGSQRSGDATGRYGKSVRSAYAKALALAGLTLCRDAALATAAAESLSRRPRHQRRLPGIVMDQLQTLDALAVADPAGTLREVRSGFERASLRMRIMRVSQASNSGDGFVWSGDEGHAQLTTVFGWDNHAHGAPQQIGAMSMLCPSRAFAAFNDLKTDGASLPIVAYPHIEEFFGGRVAAKLAADAPL